MREQLVGVWSGSGKLNGLAAAATQRWSSELGNRFVKLALRMKLQTPDGKTSIFEGDAYYPAKQPCPCKATWFDTNGDVYEIRAEESESKLVAEWGPHGEVKGRTEYRLTGQHTLEVTDWFKAKDGTWREFARISFRRQE